jgi:hypothetical protein
MSYLQEFSICIRGGGIVLPEDPKPLTLANPKRFRTIQDLTKMRPDCGASIDDIVIIDNELLLIVDISQLGDMLNPFNSTSASYVRTHGVIVGGYVFEVACPVLWNAPFLLLPLSHHLKDSIKGYTDIGKIVGNISCPSGSFLLLPFRGDMPAALRSLMPEALKEETGVKIKLPNGTYRVFYEQFEVSEGSKQEFYQNIVVQKQ